MILLSFEHAIDSGRSRVDVSRENRESALLVLPDGDAQALFPMQGRKVMSKVGWLTALITLGISAEATTLRPSQDTTSYRGAITLAASKATVLSVSATQDAFIQFNLAPLGQIQATQVASAQLTIFLPIVTSSGSGVDVNVVDGFWDEAGAQKAPSSQATPAAAIPSADLVQKNFVTVDVTAAVQAWIAAPSSNHGFSIESLGSTRLSISSKEGPATGPAAQLDVEVYPAGVAPLAVPNGGTGATSPAAALAALGGQPENANLSAIATDSSSTINVGNIMINLNTLSGNFVQFNPQTRPSNPTEGLSYEDSSDHTLYVYDGSTWRQADGANTIATSTGTGSLVLSSSPAITGTLTMDLASFTNTQGGTIQIGAQFDQTSQSTPGELVIQTNITGANALVLRNTAAGFNWAATAYRSAANYEHGAIGLGTQNDQVGYDVYHMSFYHEMTDVYGEGWTPSLVWNQQTTWNGTKAPGGNVRLWLDAKTGLFSLFPRGIALNAWDAATMAMGYNSYGGLQNGQTLTLDPDVPILTLGSDGASAYGGTLKYGELRFCDENWGIIGRSGADAATGSDYNAYCGTFAQGGGHRFYVNGRQNGLGLSIASDVIAAQIPLVLVPQGAPSAPSEGTVYFDSSSHHFFGWNGSAWVQLDN